ncbi:MAG: thiamine pyrophosphate-binding protein [Ardenticatenaceae bacterium]
MRKLSGGQAAIESLKVENVRHVFGLIGSATIEMFDALYDATEINFIGVRDERTGTHMADGYARASGGPGVILAGQNGPGATNLVTGLAQAKAAFSPVVALAGSLASGHVDRDAFQEVDQLSLFRPITKKTWTVTQPKRLPEMFREAFRVALAPRQGPVQLNLPRDILAATAEYPTFQSPKHYRSQNVPAGSAAAIQEAAELLRSAVRPVIVAGGGIKNTVGHEAALELAEALNAPIVTSPGHGDAIPFGHRLNAGQMGPRGNVVASRLVKEADVILALGTRLGFNSTFYSYDNINKQADIIHVELDPTAIGRFFPVTVGIWADAPTAARQLREALANVEAKAEVEAWTKQYIDERAAYLEKRDADADLDAYPIVPSGLFKGLRDALPRDASITLDAGTLCLQATDALNYWRPQSLFTPLDFGLVGFSLACGLGVKAARPDSPVISLCGDGGFGMTLSELSTAVEYGLNTVIIVMNNQCWGAEKAYQRDFFGERYIGADISSPPFDKVAELYGAAGYRVERVSEIGEAVQAALHCGKPAVIDVAVDPNALYSFRRDSFKHRTK